MPCFQGEGRRAGGLRGGQTGFFQIAVFRVLKEREQPLRQV